MTGAEGSGPDSRTASDAPAPPEPPKSAATSMPPASSKSPRVSGTISELDVMEPSLDMLEAALAARLKEAGEGKEVGGEGVAAGPKDTKPRSQLTEEVSLDTLEAILEKRMQEQERSVRQEATATDNGK